VDEMQEALDELWDKYDWSRNGTIDKRETRAFVEEFLRKSIDESAFRNVFRTIKFKQQQTIDKEEMLVVIK